MSGSFKYCKAKEYAVIVLYHLQATAAYSTHHVGLGMVLEVPVVPPEWRHSLQVCVCVCV